MNPHLQSWLDIRRLALVLLLSSLPSQSDAGVALKLEYDGIAGNAITNFTTDPSFPNGPTFSGALTTGLQEPVNFADTFGAWTRGFIEAPQTGAYTFWIASDDDGEFWLSSSENPGGKTKICENIGAVGLHNYTAKPAQQSAPVALVAGHKYYFEMFHKEGTGADFCSVAWTLPDASFQEPVPDARLWPFPVNLSDPSFPPITEGPSIISTYNGFPVTVMDGTTIVDDGRPLDLVITVEASQPAGVQWFSNGVPIPNANLLSLHLDRVTTALNGVVYSVTVTNLFGAPATASTTISVNPDVTPPTLSDALNLGNPAGDIVLVFSEALDPVSATTLGNYSINNGASLSSVVMGPFPSNVLLRASGLVATTSYAITVSNVKDLATAGNNVSPNPSTVVLEQRLHTWLRMDETAAPTASDSSGNNRDASFVNGPLPGYSGKVQRAIKFDGVASHLRGAGSADDFSTNGMTVALWANPTSSLTSWARFMDYAVGSFADNILFARNATSADLTFEVYNGSTSGGKVTATGVIVLNQWQHFAATMDASGNVIVYKNGVAVASGATAVPNAVTRNSNFVARSNMAQDGYFQGKMDDFRLYTRVLDPASIAALAAGGGADDVSVPTVSVAVSVATTALKNTAPGVFSVTRTGSTASPFTVNYTLGGTATNGIAYTNLSGALTIPAGTNSAQIFIKPIDFSFSQLQQTVVLTVAPNLNYTIGEADSGTVTIQNNDVAPAAIVADADNAIGAVPTTIDVWFGAAVALPSATNLANYALVNAPGLSITNAALTPSRNLRVVLGVSGPLPTNASLTVTGVQDAGGNTAPSTVPIRVRVNALDVAANIYHSPTVRSTCFSYVTDGVVNNVNNANAGFDTFAAAANTASNQFAGLIYAGPVEFFSIKVDLGRQFGDGGDWQSAPKVYILKRAVDLISTTIGELPLEYNTNDWVQVPASLLSGGQFQAAGWPNATVSPNTPYAFDLSGLTASQRTGYGWAVGGAKGNGANGFLSFSELRAYGYAGPTLTAITRQPADRTVVEGQRTTFVEAATNAMVSPSGVFQSTANCTASLTYQWQRSGVNIPGATDVNYGIPPATMADNGATFDVLVGTAPGSSGFVTSRVATLTVQARTTPPTVVAATLDTFNSLIDVWFDEPVDGGSVQSPGAFGVNDPGLTLVGFSTNASGFCATLNFVGSPTVPGLTIGVTNVQDYFGHVIVPQTATILSQNWPVANVVGNAYQQNRTTACLPDSTNGIVTHAAGDGNVWETFEGTKDPYASDFVGLLYPQAQVFGIIKVDLGHQFGDGGDWSVQPFVYILTNNVDTSTLPPETNPNWAVVPATLMSGNAFDYALSSPVNTDPPPNTPIAFDLTHLPLQQRVGYGWAVGGTPGNCNGGGHFLSISELRAFGVAAGAVTNIAGAPQILLDVSPRNLVEPVGLPLVLSVYAAGTQPISYQWQLNGANLPDNGHIIGAHSNILTIPLSDVADAGNYRLMLNNSAGGNTSAVATVSFTGIALNNGGGWSQNTGTTNVPIANQTIMLTDGAINEVRSSFLNVPAYIGAFVASWIYQDIGGGGADGTVFVLQNDPRGPAAMGGGGGTLGYNGIIPSVGLEFNIYSGNAATNTSSGVAFRANGATGKPYDDATPVNPASGNPIAASVRYDGVTAFVSLRDTVTGGIYTSNYVVDLPTLLGTNTAYVGFTGASGGVASKQIVTNFLFASLTRLALQPVGPGTYIISWPSAALGLSLQQSTSLNPSAVWSNVPNPVNSVNGQNQVTVTVSGATRFYRLGTP